MTPESEHPITDAELAKLEAQCKEKFPNTRNGNAERWTVAMNLAMEVPRLIAEIRRLRESSPRICPHCSRTIVGRSDKTHCGREACRKWVYRNRNPIPDPRSPL